MKRLLKPCFSEENGGFCVFMRMIFQSTHKKEYYHKKVIIFSIAWVILLSFYSSASASSAACDSCIHACQGISGCCTGSGCLCEDECSYGNCPPDQSEKWYCTLTGDCWVIGCACITPITPGLLSPADGATDIFLNPTLDWSDSNSTSSYDIQVCSDSTCSSIAASTNVSVSQWQVSSALNPGISHWWQVRAKNSCTSGVWSAARKFTTVCTAPPAIPELLSPTDSLSAISFSPTLDWSDVTCASTYDVRVCSDNACSSVVTSSNVSDSQWQITLALSPVTTYWWQVRASNSIGNSSWSATRQFTTVIDYALRVAVGDAGTILTSSDSISWTSWVSQNSNTGNALCGVTYGKNTFVAVGQIGTIVTSSSKGNVWTSRTSGTSNNLWGVVYGKNAFVAVGEYGTILISLDGNTWTLQISGTTNYFSGVTYGKNTFVAVGGSGTIRTSSDGITWTSRTSGTSQNLLRVTYGKNTFVAVGQAGIIYTSSDGITWTSRTSGTSQHLLSVTYGNKSFGAVGVSGIILTSSEGIVWKSQASSMTRSFWGITTIHLLGDLDDDGFFRLQDAILAFQFLSGLNPAIAVSSVADVNGDGKIGLAEMIYILQKVAGMRQD